MASSQVALERIQAQLQVGCGGWPKQEHVERVARALAPDRADELLAQLESLRDRLRQQNYRGAPAPDPEEHMVVDAAVEEKRQQWCLEAPRLVRPPSDPTAAPHVLCAVQSFMEDAAMLEWAGAGFGRQESLHIAMSLRKLAAETPSLQRLRLWGKVLGTEADYYVAEGQLQALDPVPPAGPILPGSPDYDVEPRGEGANTSSYWVTAGGAAPWVRLPAARSSYIKASRSIQRMLTGNLASPVHAISWFPADERHLLRAQIARITATCTLAVKGWYEADDEAGKQKIKEVESPAESFPSQEELAKQGGWVHAAPCLLSTGRATWPDLEPLEGLLSEEATKEWQQMAEDEPEKGMLESIEGDLEEHKPEDAEGSPAWCVKTYGTDGLVTVEGPERTFRAAAAHSLIWPGAVTVAMGTRFANLYVGYGLKCSTMVPRMKETGFPLRGASPWATLEPGEIMDEPPDHEEVEEPNPQQEEDASDKGDVDDE